jgi:hypothetical protein
MDEPMTSRASTTTDDEVVERPTRPDVGERTVVVRDDDDTDIRRVS